MPVQDLSHVRTLLTPPVYGFFAGAAGEESTHLANAAAFKQLLFRPRTLVPVSNVDTTTTIPNLPTLPVPIIIAPMAMQRMAHPEGEIAIASAAKKHAIPYTLSTYATSSIEQVASVAGPRLFQIYVYKNRSITQRLLKRAANAGYSVVVLTVDVPRFGKRPRDKKHKFQLPDHLQLANFSDTRVTMRNNAPTLLDELAKSVEDNLTPPDIAWISETSNLPVWVKGILRADDAIRAVDAGAAAVVVSNHGGRQLDGAVTGLYALPEIVKAVGKRVPVLVDGGVRCGEDVVRALALGARAVLIGRPLLWAVAQGGCEGVDAYLKEIREEVELTMVLCGARQVNDITRDMVVAHRSSKM